MKNDRTKTSDIAWLENRIRENRLQNERREQRVARDLQQIAMANEEHARLRRVLHDAMASRNRPRLPGTRRVSLKNESVLRVWGAIQDVFSGQFAREGFATNELSRAIRAAIPGIPESTVRSHLHRFKRQSALTKIGFRWFLAPPLKHRALSDVRSDHAATQGP